MIFECLRMFSSFAEDKLVIPVKGRIKIECRDENPDFSCTLFIKI